MLSSSNVLFPSRFVFLPGISSANRLLSWILLPKQSSVGNREGFKLSFSATFGYSNVCFELRKRAFSNRSADLETKENERKRTIIAKRNGLQSR